jgi:Ca2+-binding EF-hand superfamily protein
VIGNYCTLGKLSLILFAFDIYDKDHSGYIDLKEAQSMVKDVYGTKYDQNVHAKRFGAPNFVWLTLSE